MGGGGALVNHFWVPFFILLSIFAISRSDPDCVYTVYVQTGSRIGAGTDSIITLSLFPASGFGIRINNLVAWGGRMGPDYDYFERGNLDIFSGRGPCLTGPVCAMNLTSDGSGSHPAWYCDFVEVTTTGLHTRCYHHLFTVEQWLRRRELTAFMNDCLRQGGDSESFSTVSVI